MNLNLKTLLFELFSSNYRLSGGDPPRPVATPPVQEISVGEPATFSCDPRSEAPASVRWEHKGTEILEDGNIEMRGTELVIHEANELHSGLYVCKATNPYGEGTSEPVVLNVNESNTIIFSQFFIFLCFSTFNHYFSIFYSVYFLLKEPVVEVCSKAVGNDIQNQFF